jgi:hypothetical protein
MANAIFNAYGWKIAQGTGFLYLNTVRPAPGARVLVSGDWPPQIVPPTPVNWAANNQQNIWDQIIDANGNVQQAIVPGTTGTPSAPAWATALYAITVDNTVEWMNLGTPGVSSGVTEGAITVELNQKTEKVGRDQSYSPIDSVLSAQSIRISGELQSSDLSLIARLLPSQNLSSGTDSGLPTGAQNYYEITAGGSEVIAKQCVTVVIPKRQFRNPTRNYVVTGYLMEGTAQPYSSDFSRSKKTTWKFAMDGFALWTRATGDQLYSYYEQI